MEGLQWRAVNDAGQLANPIFLDIVNRLMPYYWMRLLGGSLYLIGMLMFVFNLLKTIAGSGTATSKEMPVPAPAA
jgi:cytochrome c oxidase cbb3-type subunit I/II